MIGAGILFNCGCAGFWQHRESQIARRDHRTSTSGPLDAVWKAGYGFNNPNPDRVRQGLEPVGFDGRTDDDESFFEGWVGNFLGDMITYGFKSSVVASQDLWRRMTRQ